MYLPATTEIAVSSDVKFHNIKSKALLETEQINSKSTNPAHAQNDDARKGVDIPEMDIDEFKYLEGTRHIDSIDGCMYETTRFLEEGNTKSLIEI